MNQLLERTGTRGARVRSSVVCLLVPLFFACAAAETSEPGAENEGDGRGTPSGSSSPGPSGPSGKPASVTAATACAAFAKEHCAKEKSCSAFRFGLMWGDDATCEARASVGCAERFTEPGVTWKPDGLDACAKAISGVSCDDLVVGVLPAVCKPSAGTLAASESCAHDEQCTTGFCKKASFGACGSCAEREKEGGSCGSGGDCAPGLVCSERSCRVPVKAGASCGYGEPCAPGLVCNEGQCAKGAPAGTTCGETPDAPDPCDHASGVVCSPLVMSCVAAKVVPTGGSCNPYQDVCAAGGLCDSLGSSGECVPAPREGDACTVTGDAQCLAPSVCELGKCTLPTAAACKK